MGIPMLIWREPLYFFSDCLEIIATESVLTDMEHFQYITVIFFEMTQDRRQLVRWSGRGIDCLVSLWNGFTSSFYI